MTRTLALLAALTLAAPAAAQTLDTRAVSQRTCLGLAQAAGYHVHSIARPVPIMGRLGHVLGETVRLHLSDGRLLTCIYDFDLSEAELRWL